MAARNIELKKVVVFLCGLMQKLVNWQKAYRKIFTEAILKEN